MKLIYESKSGASPMKNELHDAPPTICRRIIEGLESCRADEGGPFFDDKARQENTKRQQQYEFHEKGEIMTRESVSGVFQKVSNDEATRPSIIGRVQSSYMQLHYQS